MTNLTKLIFHIITTQQKSHYFECTVTLIYDDVNGFLDRNLQTTTMYIDVIIWLSNSIQDNVSGD